MPNQVSVDNELEVIRDQMERLEHVISVRTHGLEAANRQLTVS